MLLFPGSKTKVMQFHLLSFEGPDPYSRAGGLATRIAGLAETLVLKGYETHLWYVGDPFDAGHEERDGLKLHRWCQWVSRYHPGGVYDGEEGKRIEYAHSLPPFLVESSIHPAADRNERTVVLAEEWHTVDAVLHLDWLLRRMGLRDRVDILWNANNMFGVDRIDWTRLADAAMITTVSRYMKHRMQHLGVQAVVIPNGLASEAFLDPDRGAVRYLRTRFAGRTVLSKVARFDPDKQWLLAIRIVAALKQRGSRPLLLGRGGLEAHGDDVMRAAAMHGLRVEERRLQERGAQGLVAAIADAREADVVNIRSHLDIEMRRVLFRAADAVLANSSHEPFGLVGLETMAVGGLACTGYSGEDYVIPNRNALAMQTENPLEFVSLFDRLRGTPNEEMALRRAGQRTARHYAWPEIVKRNLFPHIELNAGNAMMPEPT
jgi:glycosyltransferase involved in cell wall biosynthesis